MIEREEIGDIVCIEQNYKPLELEELVEYVKNQNEENNFNN
jgi:hypothetical protein